MSTQLSASALASISSQKLLSQFVFLQDRNVLQSKKLFEKLSDGQFKSKQLSEFVNSRVLQRDTENCEKNDEFLREEFNGIVLDLIDEITSQFESQSTEISDAVIRAANDLNILYNDVFKDEALRAGWWSATETSRWRGASIVGNETGTKLMFGVSMAVEL